MNTLLIIHNGLSDSPQTVAYIRREFEACAKKVTNTLLVDENDASLFLILESSVSLSKTLLVITSKKSFATVGKILCTLNDDELDAKETLLIPKKADIYDESGYLLVMESCHINVMHTEFGRQLSPILLHEKSPEITLNLFGVEADDAKTLLTSIAESCRIRLATHPHVGGWGILRVHSDISCDINHFLDQVEIIFGNKVIVGDDIAEHLVARLVSLKKKISFAESCTGGRIASLLTGVSGSSAVFDGSMITYANEIKAGWLGVNATSLTAYGAVSSVVVEEMAAGILQKSGADYAVAVSGVAGPTGGSAEKPVGTVYIACASREAGIRSERLALQGDREYIQTAAAYNALRLLIDSNYELI